MQLLTNELQFIVHSLTNIIEEIEKFQDKNETLINEKVAHDELIVINQAVDSILFCCGITTNVIPR